MSKLQVINTVTNAVEVFETKKEIVKFIAAANVTTDSAKKIEKNVTAAIKDESVLYETFKIENFKEEETMTTEQTVEATETTQGEEIVYDTPESLELPEVETKNEETPVVTETEVPAAETKNEGSNETENEIEPPAVEIENADTPAENPENPEQQSETPPAAEGEKTDDKPTEEEKPNKRRVGKTLIAYLNNVEIARFPSIKAAAEHFKKEMNLGHMPFTPIMKSVRQNIDWNAYSFAFENEADLHIPESLKKKIAESQAKAAQQSTQPAENAAPTTETPVAENTSETIEEIVEVPVEEIV